MSLTFEWDFRKADINFRKHGISFEEATTVFGDSLSLTIHDPLHSHHEDRFVIVGQSVYGRLLIVVHAEQGNHIRIISARKATSQERNKYEKKN